LVAIYHDLFDIELNIDKPRFLYKNFGCITHEISVHVTQLMALHMIDCDTVIENTIMEPTHVCGFILFESAHDE
jgi:hypothetical protein